MPEKCNKRLEFRTYERKGDVILHGHIDHKPPKAPKPRKTKAQIIKELTSLIDEQIKARNNRTLPTCGRCDSSNIRQIGSTSKARTVMRIWEEKFQLKKDGKIIEGVAKYRAVASVRIRTTYHEIICDEPFGDDASGFKIEDFDHDEPTKLEGYSDEDIKAFEKYLMESFEKYSKIDPVYPVKEPEEKKRKRKKSKKGK
ncbi:MAG: hypothetical protein JJ858_11110 [Rhizobiaceae bacterium]|nr:hypothetical protein [Rhizobiaceae bacterium]